MRMRGMWQGSGFRVQGSGFRGQGAVVGRVEYLASGGHRRSERGAQHFALQQRLAIRIHPLLLLPAQPESHRRQERRSKRLGSPTGGLRPTDEQPVEECLSRMVSNRLCQLRDRAAQALLFSRRAVIHALLRNRQRLAREENLDLREHLAILGRPEFRMIREDC